VTEQLELPPLEDQLAEIAKQSHQYVREETIRRGDTMSGLLLRLGVEDSAADKFMKTDPVARELMQLRADKTVRVKTNDDGDLEWLQSTLNGGDGKTVRNLEVRRQPDGSFIATDNTANLERRIEMAAGNIRSSLFAATDEAHISDAISSQIVAMFETNIDFRRLQRGDKFNVVYESFWQNGQLVRTGRVLAGEFTNAGKTFQSVWFDEGAGQGGYYSFDGRSLKKAFLKSPLEFTRVSSGFRCACIRFPVSGSSIKVWISPLRQAHRFALLQTVRLIPSALAVATVIWWWSNIMPVTALPTRT
jgi:DNA-directed RNA polymerase subunit H (RpoH/RPB5)